MEDSLFSVKALHGSQTFPPVSTRFVGSMSGKNVLNAF
jgi:hypothetical protein